MHTHACMHTENNGFQIAILKALNSSVILKRNLLFLLFPPHNTLLISFVLFVWCLGGSLNWLWQSDGIEK